MGEFIILVVLLILSGVFSGSETALMSMDSLRVKYLAEKDVRGARKLAELLERPDSLLSAILVGNNLVNIGASAVATVIATLPLSLLAPPPPVLPWSSVVIVSVSLPLKFRSPW